MVGTARLSEVGCRGDQGENPVFFVLAGAMRGIAGDLLFQMAVQGKRWGCLDGQELAVAAVMGALTGGLGAPAATRGGTTLFHGSDVASVERIVSKGLDKGAARALGGGDVFWSTPKPEVARIFAQANPAGGAPAIAGIRVPAGALERMQAAGIIKVEQATGAVKVLNWKSFNSVVEFFRFE
jgi:hypothetical protein